MSENTTNQAISERTKTGLEILEAAVLLGVLGDALLRQTPWGLNVLLWVGTLVAAFVALTLRRRGELWRRENLWLHGALLFFAGCFAWRDSATLMFLNVLASIAILSVLTLPAMKIDARLASIWNYCLSAFLSGFNAAFAPLMLVFDDVKWNTIPRQGWTRHLTAVLRGLAIAAPLVLIFGALFMAADAAFEGIINRTFNVDSDQMLGHILLFGFLTWISAGYLRGAIIGHLFSSGAANDQVAPGIVQSDNQNHADSGAIEAAQTPLKDTANNLPGFLTLGAIEIGVVLGLINLLFLSFVIVQLRYFFGGMELVQNTEDFKLSEYARRGFGELVTVAALVLPILLTTHWLLRRDNKITERLFNVLAGVQIALLFVIMYSALQRMLLYSSNLGYGLTELRIYTTAFMLWLALVFVWFGLTVLRGQANRFAYGALWTALIVIGGLHALNPDNLIVQHNVRLMQQGREFDVSYVSNLSADATPALVRAMPEMQFEYQCMMKYDFRVRSAKHSGQDFRSWNLARWNAKKSLQTFEGGFDTNGCPGWSESYRCSYEGKCDY